MSIIMILNSSKSILPSPSVSTQPIILPHLAKEHSSPKLVLKEFEESIVRNIQ